MVTKKITKKVKEKADVGSEFAVIKTGGKQYKVSIGDVVSIEKIKGDHKVGDSVIFDNILLVDNGVDTTIGTPYISGAEVTGNIKEIGRGKKIEVVKYKAKSRYFKNRGHRQPFFKVEITGLK